jgi:hypothetical protein
MKKNSIIILVLVIFIIIFLPAFTFSQDLTDFGLINYECDLPPASVLIQEENNVTIAEAVIINIFPGFGLGSYIQTGNPRGHLIGYEFGSLFILAGDLFFNNPEDDIVVNWSLGVFGITKLFAIMTPFFENNKPLWFSILQDIFFGLQTGSVYYGDYGGLKISGIIYVIAGSWTFINLFIALWNLGNDWKGTNHDKNPGDVINKLSSIDIYLLISYGVVGWLVLIERIYSVYRTIRIYNDPSLI